jgi:hypothetical protein
MSKQIIEKSIKGLQDKQTVFIPAGNLRAVGIDVPDNKDEDGVSHPIPDTRPVGIRVAELRAKLNPAPKPALVQKP